ncbi:MAG: GyrI-like domain-containing protein [Eubacteriales bacterium]|nr:GyrI-like domain-containing protein [Eubacteriales bacterium]
MIEVRVESKPAFAVAGKKVWISGQDNEQFGRFWAEANSGGLTDRLRALAGNVPGAVTKSSVFGVSCVEKDPNDRAFDFFIAAELDSANAQELETYVVPAAKWAIFSNRGELPMSLVKAEMHAFMEWLPASPYQHALAPELEVYPDAEPDLVEFWLPLTEK